MLKDFFTGKLKNLDPDRDFRVMVSHNMDSGGGLSGGPVLAGNRNFSKKFLSKKGSGSDGQKKIDYQYHNVLIGL